MVLNFYYFTAFALSLIFAFVYAVIYKKRFNVFITLIFAFIPIANFGYYLISKSTSVHEIIIGIKITYIGGCYLNLFLINAILDLSDLNVSKKTRLLLFSISTLTFLPTLTIGYYPLFYKSITGDFVEHQFVITKVYGPFHTVYYIQLILYLLLSIVINIYSARKKLTVSNKIIKLLMRQMTSLKSSSGRKASLKATSLTCVRFMSSTLHGYLRLRRQGCPGAK